MTGVLQWTPLSPLESRRGGGVELHGSVGKDQGKGQQGGHHGVGVCFIPPNQDEQTEAFYSSWLKSHGC